MKERDISRMMFVLFCMLASLLPSGGQSRGVASLPTSATIAHVVDGDSFIARLSDGQSRGLRLIGINAPEMTDERDDVRAWAFLAKRFAAFHLQGRRVQLAYDWNVEDKYGRLLAYIRTRDGELFNAKIIRQGFAYVFLLYPFRKDYQESFREAQRQAVRQGRGLWAKNPPAEVGLAEVQNRAGELVTVRFRCATARGGKLPVVLSSKDGKLQVLVWKDDGTAVPPASQFKNKIVVVSGLLEEEGNQPRMHVLFQPWMIRAMQN
jgi:micrococcal nuclease